MFPDSLRTMRSVVTFLVPGGRDAFLFGDVVVFWLRFESERDFTPRRFELELVRVEECYLQKLLFFPVRRVETTQIQSLCIHQSRIRTVWPAGSYNWQVRMTLPADLRQTYNYRRMHADVELKIRSQMVGECFRGKVRVPVQNIL